MPLVPWLGSGESTEGWTFVVMSFAVGSSLWMFLSRCRRASRTSDFRVRHFVVTWTGFEPILIFMIFSVLLTLILAW